MSVTDMAFGFHNEYHVKINGLMKNEFLLGSQKRKRKKERKNCIKSRVLKFLMYSMFWKKKNTLLM